MPTVKKSLKLPADLIKHFSSNRQLRVSYVKTNNKYNQATNA